MNALEATTRFLDFLDRRAVFHRGVLVFTIYASIRSFLWAADFAEHSIRPGTDIGIIIAAVLIPVTALQKFAFDTYSSARKETKEG